MRKRNALLAMSGNDVVFAVVTYNKVPEETVTLRTLSAALQRVTGIDYRILVYDNSDTRTRTRSGGIPNCVVHSAGVNRGLAKAYNDALAYCENTGAQILVTLDQDSDVSLDYVSALRERIRRDDSLAVLCPLITSRGRVISPVTVDRFGRRRFGSIGRGASALNSFSAYPVRLLQSIGGFDEFYWLDALDLATYAKIFRAGVTVELLDVTVDHELSLLSGPVSWSRLVNIAYYESSYLFEYVGGFQVLTGIARIVARSLRVAPAGSRLAGLVPVLRAVASGAAAGWRRSAARVSQ